MSIIFGLLILLGVLFLIVVILGFFLPDSWRVDKAILVNAELEDIFPFINSLKSWQDWSVWNNDNGITLEYFGPLTGQGAVQNWKGNQINGKLIITKSEANHLLEYKLELEEGRFVVRGIIVLETTMPSYTQVAWRSELIMPKNFNPVSRYQAYFLKNYFDSSMNESLIGLQSIFGTPEEDSELVTNSEI